MSRRACPDGKAQHANIDAATVSARHLCIDLNARGEYATPIYAYRCPHCRLWHITHRARWNGQANTLVLDVPRALQTWAITGVMPDGAGAVRG